MIQWRLRICCFRFGLGRRVGRVRMIIIVTVVVRVGFGIPFLFLMLLRLGYILER
jgi:hypothetical protein